MANSIKNLSTEELLEVAHGVVDQVASRSTIFDPTCEAGLPQFHEREISLGRVVGRGGFCVVKEITQIRAGSAAPSRSLRRGNSSFLSTTSATGSSERGLSRSIFSSMRSTSGLDSETGSASTPSEMNRDFIINSCRSSRPRYVMKRVSDDVKEESKETYLKGCVDLALETKFLSSLSHPHILDIRAVSSVGPFEEGYFIVVDRLKETMPKRLNRWMTTDRQTKGVTGLFTGGKKKEDDLLVNRMCVAFDIASALAYLHELRVVYRDVKPDNIGFSSSDQVKIFDFGLAKELNPDERNKDGLYRMTAFTGSVRYMAPEVGTGRPYNEKADVYSFGILLWYIMALEPPFGLYTERMIRDRTPKGHRPAIMDAWPEGIQTILCRCWSGKIKSRPSFHTVMRMLKKEVAAIAPSRADALRHQSATQPVESSID